MAVKYAAGGATTALMVIGACKTIQASITDNQVRN